MLKIKFWRIENVVLMKVLEQGEEIERGCGEFFRTDYLGLVSMYNPGILINKLFVRGKDEEDDNMVISWGFQNREEAKLYIERATEAIHACNQSIAEKPEPRSDDIETVIAE